MTTGGDASSEAPAERRPQRPRRRFLPALLAATIAMLVACCAFPAHADATYATVDPVRYAWHAETDPWSTVEGHHPLFHVLVNLACEALRALGVQEPGTYGVRVIGGFGGAAVCVILVLAADGAAWVGFALAMLLLAGRGFFLDLGTGESLAPALGAGLAVLWSATRGEVRLFRLGALIVLACLLRQDSILILFGVIVALAMRGVSRRRLTALLAWCGSVTLALYTLAWLFLAREDSFLDFLFIMSAGGGDVVLRHGVTLDLPTSLRAHVCALGVLFIGIEPVHEEPVVGYWVLTAVGLVGAVVPCAVGLLLRGSERVRPLLAAVSLTVIVRFAFYAWLEPFQYQWWEGTLVCLFLLGACLVRSPVERKRGRVVAAWGLVIVAIVAQTATHAPFTLELRHRSVDSALDEAQDWARAPETLILTYGHPAQLGLLNREHEPFHLLSGDAETASRELGRWLDTHDGPVVVVVDRFVVERALLWGARREIGRLADSLAGDPRVRTWKFMDRVMVLGFRLP